MWFEKCLDALPAVKGLKGRPRRRPAKLHADKGYDYKRCRPDGHPNSPAYGHLKLPHLN